MKAKIIKEDEKVFKPFKVEFTVKTIQEARALFHVINHSNLIELIKDDEFYVFKLYSPDVSSCFGVSISDINLIKKEIIEQGFEL